MLTFYNADIGIELAFTVFLGGRPADLTGASVDLLAQDIARSPFSCTITDEAAGKVSYIVQAGDFPAGAATAQLRVTFSPTKVIHSLPFGLASKALFD